MGRGVKGSVTRLDSPSFPRIDHTQPVTNGIALPLGDGPYFKNEYFVSDRRAVRASIASLRIQHSWLRSNRKLKYLIARSLVWRITENLNVSNNPPRLVFLICQFFFPRLDSSIHGFALSPPCVLSQTASNLSRITSQTCPRPRRLAANAAVLNLDACKCLRLKISPVVISRKRCSNSLRSRPRAKRLILDRRRLSRCF